MLARPATAVDVTVDGITWEPKESFVNYMNTQPAPGGGSYTSAGAAPGQAENRGKGAIVYRFAYRPVRGWWDAASQTAALYYGGTVNFRFFAHGIDFDAKDPEIELNGPASRAIFRLDGRRDTPYGNKRGVLVNLNSTTTAAPPCTTAGRDRDLHRHPRQGARRRRRVGVRRLLPAGRALRRHLRQLHHALSRRGLDSRAAVLLGLLAVLCTPAAAQAAPSVTVQKLDGRAGPSSWPSCVRTWSMSTSRARPPASRPWRSRARP